MADCDHSAVVRAQYDIHAAQAFELRDTLINEDFQ